MSHIEGSARWRIPSIGFDCLLIEFGKCVKEFLDSVIQSKQLRKMEYNTELYNTVK